MWRHLVTFAATLSVQYQPLTLGPHIKSAYTDTMTRYCPSARSGRVFARLNGKFFSRGYEETLLSRAQIFERSQTQAGNWGASLCSKGGSMTCTCRGFMARAPRPSPTKTAPVESEWVQWLLQYSNL